MLNRRLLRVKAMQSLYSLAIAKQSNFEMGTNVLEDYFAPDLNSMEVQDKPALKKQFLEADKWYREVIETNKKHTDHTDSEIVAAVSIAVQQYHRLNTADEKHFHNLMIRDVEEVYREYLVTLDIFMKLIEVVSADQEEQAKKHIKKDIPEVYYKLKNNFLLQKLESSSKFSELCARYHAHYDLDALKIFYRDQVCAFGDYIAYQKQASTTEEEEKEILLNIFKKLLLKDTSIEDVFESEDLNWIENKSIVKGMVVKTIKSLATSEKADECILQLSLNWDEDKKYFEDIYTNTCKEDEVFETLIQKNVQNWDIERVAITDKIIIKMALAEMKYCPSIPIKVSINEFIELSKEYSTPKSKQFVNGLLDKLSDDLQKEGIIKKSGRGLIDN